MNLSFLTRPEYLLRPSQAIKRLLSGRLAGQLIRQITLPWGLELNINSDDELGSAIQRSGIYDLCLTEMIWRLTAQGDVCIDVGANIGYATSLFAKQSSPGGTVYCFEPHPGIYTELSANIELWKRKDCVAKILPIKSALSNRSGKRALNIPPDFITNRGMCHFYEENEKPDISAGEVLVDSSTLDDFIANNQLAHVAILKIDAEGHEMQVLEGGLNAIKKGVFKYIIFEDSRSSWRTPAQLYQDYRFIHSLGLSIFRVKRGFLGPVIENMELLQYDHHSTWTSWEPPNFVVTAEPSATASILGSPGWYALLNRPFKS